MAAGIKQLATSNWQLVQLKQESTLNRMEEVLAAVGFSWANC